MGDFHELKLGNRNVWSQVSCSPLSDAAVIDHGFPLLGRGNSTSNSVNSSMEISDAVSPGARFCHVGVVYKSALYSKYLSLTFSHLLINIYKYQYSGDTTDRIDLTTFFAIASIKGS